MLQDPVHQRKAVSPESASPESEGKSLTPPAFQLKASEGPAAPPPAQLKQSSSGMPSDLVSGFAATTGHDLSDVNVVRNSDKPAQVGALAFAQGNDIHLAPGQEQHLAHEAGHIVQQREGQVQANTQVNGKPVNDQQHLETAATEMGEKAMQMKAGDGIQSSAKIPGSMSPTQSTMQQKLMFTGEDKNVQDVVKMLNASVFGYSFSIDKAGYLEVAANNVEGPPMSGQTAMYKYLKQIIDDPGDVKIQVDAGNKAVIVGSYDSNTIDLSDMALFGNSGGASTAGTLIHELVEQYHKQVKGEAYGGEGLGAHGEGILAENEVNDCVRGAQKIASYKDNGDGTFDALVEIPYTYSNGREVTTYLTIVKGDLTKVENKETKAATK